MQNALNHKNFQVFVKRLKGARLGEMSVKREEGPKGVRLKYSARDPKTRQIFNGEWIVPRDAAEAGEKEFFALAEKEFAVRREGA
jgi:hypothetical protein